MSKPEYLEFRCCMCPNIQKDNNVCPGIKDTPHPNPTKCRFVKTYLDKRGWKYKVMSGIGEDAYKGRYQKPSMSGWKCMKNLEWKKSFDEAQSDLNAMAKLNRWIEVE